MLRAAVMLKQASRPRMPRSAAVCAGYGSQPDAAPGTLPVANAGTPNRHRQMKQHLAVSAIGSDRTGMVHDLTRVISESGGNISESRMASLGTEFAMLLLVSGNWHSLAKLETELKRLADTSNLSIHLKRTEPRTPRTDMLPYSIDVVCLDQSGIVSGLSGFFASRGIDPQLPGSTHRRADVRRADDRERAEPHPRGTSARGVHGVLRLAQPRCDSRTGKILKRDVRAAAGDQGI